MRSAFAIYLPSSLHRKGLTVLRTALLSVYYKDGIVEFARQLVDLGWQILSSGGTARTLAEAGVPVTDVASVVGEPILGHRVVTLSREIHAGIMARDIPEDRAELERLGIPWINLVCVDLYPLENALADPNRTLESVVEKTDVGGPTLLHSAAKGQRLVICDSTDRQRVIDAIRQGTERDLVEPLAAKAEATVARYLLASARFRGSGAFDGFIGERVLACKYGENACQTPAALYSLGADDSLALDKFTLVAGTAPSYINLTDVERLLQTMTHVVVGFLESRYNRPDIAIAVKHGNACGAAYALEDPSLALIGMIEGHPEALFGGSVMVNFELDATMAMALYRRGARGAKRVLDVVVAPSFGEGAVDALRRKNDKCRMFVNPALAKLDQLSLDQSPRLRYVRGGFLRQPNYTYVLDTALIGDVPAIGAPLYNDVIFAWAIGSTSTSNTITLVKQRKLIANAVGQPSRVLACKVARMIACDAGHDIKGAVAYSDSFFPFDDGPRVLADAGVKTILTSSGSVRDGDVVRFCQEAGVALYLVPDAEGRGFYGH